VHERHRQHVAVVFELFAETVGQAGKAAVPHANREVGTLNVARARQLNVGRAKHRLFATADDRIESPLVLAINFHEAGIVHFIEVAADGPLISRMTVCGDLETAREAFGEVCAERIGRGAGAVPYPPRWNQFGIRTKRRPGPHVTGMLADGVFLLGFLAAHKAPNLVKLEHLTWQVHHLLMHVGGASIPRLSQQLHNAVLGNARDPRRAEDGIAFDQAAKDGGAFGGGELFHSVTYDCAYTLQAFFDVKH
jgi:hypothetical protein